MPNRAILPILAATMLGCASAAWSQPAPPNFPDGPGKDIVVATCGGCHAINRLRAGYTPAGWNMLQHMPTLLRNRGGCRAVRTQQDMPALVISHGDGAVGTLPGRPAGTA